jgi:hypothetical protein
MLTIVLEVASGNSGCQISLNIGATIPRLEITAAKKT